MAKILVIDDDRGIRHLLDALLSRKGYHVLHAGPVLRGSRHSSLTTRKCVHGWVIM